MPYYRTYSKLQLCKMPLPYCSPSKILIMINKSLELLSHIFLYTLYKTTPNSQKQKVSHKDETLYTTWKTVFATAFFNEVFSVTRLVLWRQKIVHFGSFLKALTILQSGNLVTLICIHKMKRKWKTLMKKEKKSTWRKFRVWAFCATRRWWRDIRSINLNFRPFLLVG